MTRLKFTLIFIFLMFAFNYLNAQSLTLQECYEAARNNSPLKNQQPNNSRISNLAIQSLEKERLPQFIVNGQYTYQSDVVSFPDFPGIAGPDIPKNQYKLSLDVNQNLFSGNRVARMIEIEKVKQLATQQETEVVLSSIRNSVNELFFAALSLQEREKIYDLIIKDLQERLKIIRSLVRNGVLLSAEEKSFLIQLKKAQQEKVSLHYQKTGVIRMLAEKTGLDILREINLEIPENQIPEGISMQREEKVLFEYTRNALETQKDLSNLGRLPRLSAFGSAGIGDPNPVNFFETGISEFYIVGLKLSWNVWDWNHSKRSRQILDLQQQNLFEEERNFDLNVSTQLASATTNLEKLRALLDSDQEILALQTEITEEAFSRYRQGLITSSEYSTELNRQIQAQLKLKVREIEISQAIVNILTLTGNI